MDSNDLAAAMDQAAQGDALERVIDGVIERVISNSGSRTVFGEPVREEARTVIPVARLTYRFGFGGGSGPSERAGEPQSGGGGGGGDLNARPVGFIETTASGSRFVPIIDWSRIISMATGFFGVGLLLFFWSKRQ